MTTYFVDFVNGSDANNGLGPDASAVSNKPWKTITKALGASGISSGDTVYLSPAGPFRETVSVAMTSPVAETKVLGDPWNQQGFKTSGGARVAPGPVIVTAYTTNDKTAPSSTTLLNLNGRDFLTFERLLLIGANTTASCVTATTTTSTNITFRDCAFVPRHNDQTINATTVFGTAFTWLFDRCYFAPCSGTQALLFTCPTGSGSDYDVGVTIRNSVFLAAGSTQAVSLATSGASAQKPGGIVIRNCTFMHCRALLYPTNGSSSIPGVVSNNVIYSMDNIGITANGGAVTADHNLIYAGTATSGSGTITVTNTVSDASYAPLFNFASFDRIWSAPEPRPWMEPLKDSPALAFGNDGSQTSSDLVELPRPVTALAAAGAFGTRHNTFTRDTSPIGGGGAFALKLTGPGDYGVRIPISSGLDYDITVDVQWDATYAGTKPQLRVDANPRVGVAEETVTAVGSSGSPETLTLSTITPTLDDDFIIVRVISNDSNGGGLMQTDDLTITVS